MKYDSILPNIKNSALVFDIETCAFYPHNGKCINISSDFVGYVQFAEVKWFGAYSYKTGQVYLYNVKDDRDKIIKLFETHKILVGFNSEEFDYPILINNGLCPNNKRFIHVDCMQILGKSNFKNRQGYPYKNRGELMDYSFKNNKLRTIAETMKLETQKGDIDYKIFEKDTWTEEEIIEIKKYLKDDIMAPKQMFDKLWNYWKPFTEMLNEKYVRDLSWLRNSIASLIYKCVCSLSGVEATYSEHKSKKEEMGGNVIEPKYEEATDVWYVDFASLYPHLMIMFNLFAETVPGTDKDTWHGNDLFKVKGYYNISEPHFLSGVVKEKLKERINLKKTDKDNPMVYTIKIFCNGLYGLIRSPLFEKMHSENGGWDTCWCGQQIQKLASDMMEEFGFETLGGDTDSLMLRAYDKKNSNEKYVRECLNKIVNKIDLNVPFPVGTFNIDIEEHIKYIKFPFSLEPVVEEKIRKQLKDNSVEGYIKKEEDGKKIIIQASSNKIVKKGRTWVKELRAKKKNYLYSYEKDGKTEIELIGLPIKKDNATPLGLKIYKEILKEQIIKQNHANFTKEYVDGVINKWLKSPEILKLLAVEYKIKPAHTYKKESQIQAQISNGYLNGQDGIIFLIKNNKIGKAGKGDKYCTVDEAKEAGLTTNELILDKTYKELEPFIVRVDK